MNIREMKAVYTFGKVDGYGNGRRSCQAAVEVRYTLVRRNEGGHPEFYWEFAACGEIWNSKHTDIIGGGQCLDEMNGYEDIRDNETFRAIYRLWKKYHLNGHTVGSPRQEEALIGCKSRKYEVMCEYLAERGLLEDDEFIEFAQGNPNPSGLGGIVYKGHPYRYGSAWLVREIPETDKVLIRALVGMKKADEDRITAEAMGADNKKVA